MSDAVIDTTVVALANKDLAQRTPGNSFDRRLRLLELAVARQMRIRYNNRLRGEYSNHVKIHRNDVMEVFFALLDSPAAVRVTRNVLTRQEYQLAVRRHRWQSHDQHLLAAAIGGDRPCIYVTEDRLARCAPGIQREFGVRVQQV